MQWAYVIIDDDINIFKEILLVPNLNFDHFPIIGGFYDSNCHSFGVAFFLFINRDHIFQQIFLSLLLVGMKMLIIWMQ